MASTLDLLKRLNDHGVKYVLVGGMACVIHGSQLVTQDVDICAPLTLENLAQLIAALASVHPRFRTTRDLRPLPDKPEELKIGDVPLVSLFWEVQFPEIGKRVGRP